MKLKKLALALTILLATTFSLFSQAHEGHAPAGVVHELHHMLWVVMALAMSAVAVFLIRNHGKKKENTED
ncbi:hypothetical protein HXX02_05430 [Microbulbifer elongatus]|uniref:Uncharacterized protein n=1 Tax=Microbulbifer elongatus TaxID=86173 RepID=A0ABT1NYG9_9GAMM|nr:hypothetical protein [Microbulbifer elongatus]MCQ3828877.1 hypothetical protein [Microbulbifer elongatus]